MTTEDLAVRNFLIPKGTAVIVNMHSMQHDAELWPDPEKFDPRRFMDHHGHYLKREEHSPFLMGRLFWPISMYCTNMDLFESS